jgi:hypothetical protein
MARLALVLLLLAALVRPAEAQHFDLEVPRDSVRIGDVVVLHARIHIGPQQTLASPVAVPAGDLPEGARFVGVDSVVHQADRTLLIGDIRVTFFRTGRLRMPPLRLIVKATPDDRGFPLESEPFEVDVVPTLPAGNPTLKDIRDDLPAKQVDPLLVAGIVAAVAAGAWLARRRLARRPARAPVVAAVPAGANPADRAREALARIESEGWLERGEVDRHYEAVAAVMRAYFGEIDPRVHAAQTSTEVLQVLRTRRTNGTWRGTARVLNEADLVKFAGAAPVPLAARGYAGEARRIIDAWSGPAEDA